MQSGITASSDLHSAFATFTSTPTLFALPVTISSESLSPLSAIPFSSPSDSDFHSSLPLLEPHLHPQKPIFLLLRRTPGGSSNDLVAVTYIPSTAPVRSKTLFASTRATLVRELGIEKFSGGSLFATEASEILDPREWADRERRDNVEGDGGHDAALLTTEERELQGVKRAEDEERHGTKGRDLMGAGEKEGGGSSVGVSMKMKDQGDREKAALRELAQSGESAEGMVVQFGIDISTESLELNFSDSNVSPSELASRIPSGKPSYTFYRYPSTSTALFIYTCPPSSKIKERMVYASSSRSVQEIARLEGVEVAKRLEAGGPEEVTEERLREEVQPKTEETAAGGRQGFARPKRPGRK